MSFRRLAEQYAAHERRFARRLRNDTRRLRRKVEATVPLQAAIDSADNEAAVDKILLRTLNTAMDDRPERRAHLVAFGFTLGALFATASLIVLAGWLG